MESLLTWDRFLLKITSCLRINIKCRRELSRKDKYPPAPSRPWVLQPPGRLAAFPCCSTNSLWNIEKEKLPEVKLMVILRGLVIPGTSG
jgi:hypothetical protein